MTATRMTEKQLLQVVLDLARLTGWLAYHTHDSRRSAEGFPDLVLCHARHPWLVFAELKVGKGKLTKAQQEWQNALAILGAACEESWAFQKRLWTSFSKNSVRWREPVRPMEEPVWVCPFPEPGRS